MRPRSQTETLTAAEDFQAAFRTGTRHATPMFIAYVRRQPDRLRVAISVGRRFGSAVVRNRVRRRMREALRQVTHLVVDEGADIVVSPRRDALVAPFEQLVDSLRNVLSAAGLALSAPTSREESLTQRDLPGKRGTG